MGLPYATEGNVLRIVREEISNSGFSAPAIIFWKDSTTFKQNDLAIYMGDIYKSLLNGNINHNPTTDKTYWVKLEHIIEYKDSLPTADEKSVTFVEVNGQLYYKTNTSNSNGYEYKPITSGSPTPHSDGITDVWVDNKSVVVNKMAIINSAVKVYSATTLYEKNDMVGYQGQIFKSLIEDNYGNNPFDTTKWRDVSKEYYNEDALLEATIDSPSLIEYRGDLYYKVVEKSEKYISYSYKKIETGGGSSAAFTKVNREDISKYSFQPDTLYVIVDIRTYTNKERYDLTSEAEDAGWDINEAGVTNPNSHIAWNYGEVPNHWETLRPLLETSYNGDLSTANDKNGNLVCKYQEEWQDSSYYSFAIYNNGLIEIPEYNSRLNTPYILETSDTIDARSREGFWFEIYELSGTDFINLFNACNECRLAYIYDSYKDTCLIPIGAKEINGVKILTLLQNDCIVNYRKEGTEIEYDIIDLNRRYIDLTDASGELEIDSTTLTDNTVIRYVDAVESKAYYLTKSAESTYFVNFSCNEYEFQVNKFSGEYEISKIQHPITHVIQATLLSLETDSRGVVKYPSMGTTLIQEILDNVDKKSVVIKADDTCYKIIYTKGKDVTDATIVLEYYEPEINDNVLINLVITDGIATPIATPVHSLLITFTEHETSGYLPIGLRTLFKHNENYKDTVFYYKQGSGPYKISKLTLEFIQDNKATYTNREFYCEVDIDTFEYSIGTI